MNLGRIYELVVQNPQKEQRVIGPPFTLELEVTRNTLASTNEAQLTITNLGSNTRNWLFKDRYNLTEYWQMSLRAGYRGNTQYSIFLGNILEAYSTKQGTEWKTTIKGYDGLFGVQNGFISQSFSSGTGKGDLANRVVESMPNIAKGLFGKPTLGESSRGQVAFGASVDVLAEQFPGEYFIDDGKLNVMSDDEIDPSSVILLDSDHLLKTPERRESFLDVSLMFIPQVKIGLLAEIKSNYPIYNGQYKVIGLKHSGIISEAINGPLTTNLNLYAGAGAFFPIS